MPHKLSSLTLQNDERPVPSALSLINVSRDTCRLEASTTRVDVRKAACNDSSAHAGSEVPLPAEAGTRPFVSDDSRLRGPQRRQYVRTRPMGCNIRCGV